MILSKSSDKAPNVWHSKVSVQTILKSTIKSITASVGSLDTGKPGTERSSSIHFNIVLFSVFLKEPSKLKFDNGTGANLYCNNSEILTFLDCPITASLLKICLCMYVKFIYSWLKKRSKLQYILIQYIKNVLQSSTPKETN